MIKLTPWYAAAWTLLTLALPLSLAEGQQQPDTNQRGTVSVAPPVTPLPTPTLIVPSTVQPDLVSPAAPTNFIIGPNDLLSVFVYQMPEMTRQLRVGASGDIRIPFASKSFHVAGETALQVQQTIAAELLAEGLVRAPIVQVTVVQVESKPIVIGGAVQKPSVVQAARPMRLVEVLSNAGGITADASDSVLVTQQTAGTGSLPATQSYSLTQLFRYNNPEDDPLLKGNEVVTVLPAQKVYVVGDFKQPGAFPITMGEPITVLRAIALGKGLDANPNEGSAKILRATATGGRTEILVNIKRILQHQSPDIDLQAGDILYVSKDTTRDVLVTGLSDVAQIITLGAAYHFP